MKAIFVVMICINARNAFGEREEPAAKGLREVVYLDPAVVQKSRAFVCVLLTAEGTSEDYGELRYQLGIDAGIESFRDYDGARALVDKARRKRLMRTFVPKGEWGNRPKQEEE